MKRLRFDQQVAKFFGERVAFFLRVRYGLREIPNFLVNGIDARDGGGIFSSSFSGETLV